eukprot:GEZU01025771.1.p1 GENE.GEZU01025771.1~~GEZU01025771.1.p1  ORF type:complete len:926 (+),score=222.24 GEZU01025771.1:26-2779(+)
MSLLDEWDHPATVPVRRPAAKAPVGSGAAKSTAPPSYMGGGSGKKTAVALNTSDFGDHMSERSDKDNKLNTSEIAEEPMFSLEQFDFDVVDRGNLRQLCANGDALVVATEDHRIFYYNLATSTLREFDVPHRSTDDEIYRAFLDPTGSHIIVSLSNGENIYMHATGSKPKRCDKMKNVVVSSIGWDNDFGTEASTGNILVGSNDGAIYEAKFESKHGLKLFRPLYDLKDNASDNQPITGLEVAHFPKKDKTEPNKYFVMATTVSRYYQFVGGPTFEAMFSNYIGSPSFNELFAGNTKSELHFHRKPVFRGKKKMLPDAFAWLTPAGIYHGNFSFNNKDSRDSVVNENSLLPWGDANPARTSIGHNIISLAITEFHMVLLTRENNLQVIMQPPGLCGRRGDGAKVAVVFEKSMSAKHGVVKGLSRDSATGNIWLYTNSEIWELVVENEDRHVWRMYLDRAMDPTHPNPSHFDTALRLARRDPKKRDKVLTAKADFYFERQKDYNTAAGIYALTSKSFEEVTLNFIRLRQTDALMIYLLRKLQQMKRQAAGSRNQEATQLNCLCTWLTEIYLDKINCLHDNAAYQQHREAVKEFHKFLEDNRDFLNPATTFTLISSHGHMRELLHYAMLIEDYERVISYYVTKKEYLKALEILSKHCNKASMQNEELFYNFSPVLMQHMPVEMVDVWISCTFLDPNKLIPALMRYDPSKNHSKRANEDQVVRYLQYCVDKMHNRDPAIHNLLLSRYAMLSDNGAQLDRFLNIDGDPEENFYDPKYALRICKEHNKYQACVKLYNSMGLHEDAVELALKYDYISLAKEIAKVPEDDTALRKRLWLLIVKHIVDTRRDVKQAIECLSECELKLEDILPFFPDHVLIDDFKEQICSALEEYNNDIEELKHEMSDATTNADIIRNDIKEQRYR